MEEAQRRWRWRQQAGREPQARCKGGFAEQPEGGRAPFYVAMWCLKLLNKVSGLLLATLLQAQADLGSDGGPPVPNCVIRSKRSLILSLSLLTCNRDSALLPGA